MKKFLLLTAVFCFTLSQVSHANASSFPDINPGSQLEKYVEYLSEKNIIQGYPDGTFHPERTINRAEALKLIFSLLLPTSSESGGQATTDYQLQTTNYSPFQDVPNNEWYSPYIAEAKEKNIIKGYPDGSFKPDQEVNRAEFIKMAMAALPFFSTITPSESETLRAYSDLSPGAWYLHYIGVGKELKLLPNTTRIRPSAPMLRGEAAEIIYKTSQYLDKHSSELSNKETFFVPPEALIEINPQKSFGSASLPTPAYEYQGSILDHHLGAVITLDHPEELESSNWVADQLSLEFKDGCFVELFRYPPGWDNAESFFEENLNALETAMMPAKSSVLRKREKRDGFQVYEVFTEWDLNPDAYEKRNMDPTSTVVFIETQNKDFVLFNGHGPGMKESECSKDREEVLKGFEMY